MSTRWHRRASLFVALASTVLFLTSSMAFTELNISSRRKEHQTPSYLGKAPARRTAVHASKVPESSGMDFFDDHQRQIKVGIVGK